MCLSYVTKNENIRQDYYGNIGYKICIEVSPRTYTDIFIHNHRLYTPNTIYNNEYSAFLETNWYCAILSYKSGFHLFVKRSDAEKFLDKLKIFWNKPFVLKKVFFKDITTIGVEEEREVVVAQTIMILD